MVREARRSAVRWMRQTVWVKKVLKRARPRESQPAFTFQKVIGGKEVEGKTDGLIFLDVVRSHDNMRQALEEEPSIPSSSMVTTTVNPD